MVSSKVSWVHSLARAACQHLCERVGSKKSLRPVCIFGAKNGGCFNGEDTSKFRPDQDRYVALRHLLGLTPDAIIFGSACRLSEEKGLDVGLDCFQQLVAAKPNLPLAWVIAGDGPLRQQIVDAIHEKGLGDRVFQIGFQKDVHELYPGFDFFVLPSRREGLPLSLVESMACGCCPITTSVDGIPEVLGSTNVGWMVPSDDRDSLTNAMVQAADLSPCEAPGDRIPKSTTRRYAL